MVEKMIVKTGIVTKSTGSFYTVRIDDESTVTCTIRGKIRTKGIRTTNPVSVGDVVDIDTSDNGCVITHIHERKNYLIRKSTNLSKESHIIAANVDQSMIIITLAEPETSTIFIDRLLASSEAYGIKAVLVFNKIDLLSENESNNLADLIHLYEKIGYQCLTTSVACHIGIAAVREALKEKITVISGISGVGKSSLINEIELALHLKTMDISSSHRTGRHTTTFAEMFPLSGGGYIIDTPGIRSFGMIDMKKEEIYHYFPEIFKYGASCRFHNCLHIHEPGCAVIQALQDGEIDESRYLSYLSMMEEEDKKYR